MQNIKYLVVLFLCFCSSNSFSQNKRIDSLTLVLNQVKNDIDKVQTLNAIADEYKTSNPKLMADFASKALQLSKKIKFKLAEGNAYLNLGNSNIISGNYSIALQNFTLAQELFENEINANSKNNLDIKKGLAKAYGSIGIVFSEQSNYAKALKYYLKSVKIYEEINDTAKCAKLYNNIGIVYKSQSSHFKALEYFIKANEFKKN